MNSNVFDPAYVPLRVAAASPRTIPGDVDANAAAIIKAILKADEAGAEYLGLPELCLTGATLGEALGFKQVIEAAKAGLEKILAATEKTQVIATVGLPRRAGDFVKSGIAIIQSGKVLGEISSDGGGLSPFGFQPEVKYERIWWDRLPFDADFSVNSGTSLFRSKNCRCSPEYIVLMPSYLNASAISRQRILYELCEFSRKGCCTVAYAGPNVGETSSTHLFDSLCAISYKGELLAVGENFGEDTFVAAQVETAEPLPRPKEPSNGFLLSCDPQESTEQCQSILELQARALETRRRRTNSSGYVVEACPSPGSSLALLACARAKQMASEDVRVLGVCIKGGSQRPRTNQPLMLCEALGIEYREIDITCACRAHLEILGYKGETQSKLMKVITNRVKKQLLFSVALGEGLLDIGSTDLLETALDPDPDFDSPYQYGINAYLPKTVVQKTLEAAADAFPEAAGALKLVLRAAKLNHKSPVKRERYKLHDFFLYQLLKNDADVGQMYISAVNELDLSEEDVYKELGVFLSRFFSKNGKRKIFVDAPDILLGIEKGQFMRPSDISAAAWLKAYEGLKAV